MTGTPFSLQLSASPLIAGAITLLCFTIYSFPNNQINNQIHHQCNNNLKKKVFYIYIALFKYYKIIPSKSKSLITSTIIRAT